MKGKRWDFVTVFWGSTIGLAGCGIWLIFVAIFGMWAENRSGNREFQLRAGEGRERDFVRLKGRDARIARGKYRDTVSFYETAWFDQLRMIEIDRWWMKCVGFEVMNWSRTSSLHVKLLWTLLWCFVLISERGIKSHVVLHFLALSAFLTFPTLSIERMLEQLWSAMVSLASMATPADGNVTTVAKNEVFGIINFIAISYEKSARWNVFLWKKKFRSEIYRRQVI